MKRTVIKYKNTVDGKIKLTGIENMADKVELKKEFGEEVSRVYLDDFPVYFKDTCNDQYFHVNGDLFGIGFIISSEKFDKMIKNMKAAGMRLQNIRREWELAEEKEIII